MTIIQRRLAELQSLLAPTSLDDAERSALYTLDRAGISSEDAVTAYQGADKWQVWAAEAIAFTASRARAGMWREAVRGLVQVAEYRGRNGGFLGGYLNDHAQQLSQVVQDKIGA